MFTKPNEPLSQSERIKNKRNREIYKNRTASNSICLDNNGNIKNVKNYETFMNTVNGYYECVKKNPSLNQNCFNTYLDDNDDIYDLSTFTDLEKSRIDFSNYDDDLDFEDTTPINSIAPRSLFNLEGVGNMLPPKEAEQRFNKVISYVLKLFTRGEARKNTQQPVGPLLERLMELEDDEVKVQNMLATLVAGHDTTAYTM